MNFQDPNRHGSTVTGGIKKCDVRTHTQAKTNMPHQLLECWGHKRKRLCSQSRKNNRSIISKPHFHAMQKISAKSQNNWWKTVREVCKDFPCHNDCCVAQT